jgi:hypothetical protein
MEEQGKLTKKQVKLIAWLSVPATIPLCLGVLLSWMSKHDLSFRPLSLWMGASQAKVVATPAHPPRITVEKGSGIFVYKRELPITSVQRKSTVTIYGVPPQPEPGLSNGFTVEFPNNLQS